MPKTDPIGVRFDKELLSAFINSDIQVTPQKALSIYESFFKLSLEQNLSNLKFHNKEEKHLAKLADLLIKNETILISEEKILPQKIKIKRSPANWVELRRSIIDESEYQEWCKELQAADYLTDLEKKQILSTN